MIEFYVKIINAGGPEVLGASSEKILQREFSGYTKYQKNVIELTIPDTFVCFSKEDARHIARYFKQNDIARYEYSGLIIHNPTAKGDIQSADSDTDSTDSDMGSTAYGAYKDCNICGGDKNSKYNSTLDINSGHESTELLTCIGAFTAFPCLTASDTARAAEIIRGRIVQRATDNGAVIYCPQTVTIGFYAEIEPHCVIYQNNYIMGKTVIGSKTQLLPNNIITDTVIAKDCRITSSTLTDAQVGEGSTVGPNAYIRPGSQVGRNCRIGDFVEVKNSQIGDGTKIAHLSYIGDAELGKNINIGCGVVFVNYNGKYKSRISVGDNSFIGCNSNLIAPLKIQSDCYIAAGTTVTEDLQKGDFCIGRSRQTVKPGKAYAYLKKD